MKQLTGTSCHATVKKGGNLQVTGKNRRLPEDWREFFSHSVTDCGCDDQQQHVNLFGKHFWSQDDKGGRPLVPTQLWSDSNHSETDWQMKLHYYTWIAYYSSDSFILSV